MCLGQSAGSRRFAASSDRGQGLGSKGEQTPVSPYPLNLGGGPQKTLQNKRFQTLRPLNLGGESSPPEFRGYGLIGTFRKDPARCRESGKEKAPQLLTHKLAEKAVNPVTLVA